MAHIFDILRARRLFHAIARQAIIVSFMMAVAIWVGWAATVSAQAQGYYDGGNGASERSRYCSQLEQQLAEIWIQGNQPNTDLTKLRQDIRKARRGYRSAKRAAERANCYEEMLFFGRSLRKTRKCIRLDRKAQEEERQVRMLENRLRSATNVGATDGRRSQLLDELARNGCGATYQREARRRSNNFFDSLFGGGDYYGGEPRYNGRPSAGILPYATYRTMCVRKCDGYYFPVSYSALSAKFNADAEQCLSSCAAPAELFVYRNPGEQVEQMISLYGFPYQDLPNAWRYRKEFVQGCSCKPSEYSPVPAEGLSDGAAPGSGSGGGPETEPSQDPSNSPIDNLLERQSSNR